MNLSMQIGRAMFAVVLSVAAVAGAFAQSDSDADAQAPAVAHSRLEIAPAGDAKDAAQHWVVASVRVGVPVAEPHERARVVARERVPFLPALPRS